jgi:serine/threonine protein phosphatase PrpC
MENQDTYACHGLGDGFVLAVADGAGSARLGTTGARIAVETACRSAVAVATEGPSPRDAGLQWARDFWESFHSQIAAMAHLDDGLHVEDYATTLLAVVAQPPHYYYLSIGDGFLVAEHAGRSAHLIVIPDLAHENGSTVFLTSVGAEESLRQGAIVDADLTGLALCTDGLLDAVLTSDRAPGGGPRFLAPPDFLGYFEVFRDPASASGLLTERLMSPDFAAATADDKTMVLAVRV